MSIHSDSTMDENTELVLVRGDYPHDSDSTSDSHSERSRKKEKTDSIAYYSHQLSHRTLAQPPPIFFCSPCSSSSKEEEDEYLSEEFITKFNERIGDKTNIRKARRLMKKMKILAGLHPSSSAEELDIPSARFGFALLAGLNHHELKLEALENLEYLLEHDPVTEASSIRLVALAIKVMNQLDRELMQTEVLEVQIKSAKIYGLLAEMIQRHMAKKHINAITDDLRNQLLQTARALRDLNRLEDPRLDCYVESALEGIKRILDDHKVLYEVVERLYNATMIGVSIYLRDLSEFPQFVQGAINGVDLKIKFGWYDAVMTLLKLGREAMNDHCALAALQKFIYDNGKKLNWRFLYLAVDILTNIAISSPDPRIRKLAFSGNRFVEDFPGLLKFAGWNRFGKKLSITPIVRLERPKLSNKDALIRLAVAKSLIKVSNECPDNLIRIQARSAFLNQYRLEKSKKVREYMTGEFNKIQGRELAWIHEDPPYNCYPIEKKNRYESPSLTPRRNSDCSDLFYRTIGLWGKPGFSEFDFSAETEPHITVDRLIASSNELLKRQLYTEAAVLITSGIKNGISEKFDMSLMSTLYLKRGHIFRLQGYAERARADFIKALEYSPKNEHASDALESLSKESPSV